MKPQRGASFVAGVLVGLLLCGGLARADDSRAVHALERIATALEKTCR